MLSISDALPNPPVPADCDLRGLPYYPLNLQRLVRSTFHNQASPLEWKAGLLLWMKSWDQLPSGSLPSDDRELSSLAELRDVRAWLRVKEMSLHGWALYSDGRYYHPVVTEVTLNAWGKRNANRHRTQAASEARWAPIRNGKPDAVRNGVRNVHQVISKKEGSVSSSEDAVASPEKEPAAGAAAQPIDDALQPIDPVKDMWDRGLAILGEKHRSLLGKFASQYGKPAVLAAIVECEREQPVEPVAYFIRCCEERRKNGRGDQAHAYEVLARAAIEFDERQSRRGDPETPH